MTANAISHRIDSISIEDIYNSDYVLDIISDKLLHSIEGRNEYSEEINYNNFEVVYGIEYERHETIYLLVYKEGAIFSEYYIVLTAVNKQNGEVKVLIISKIKEIEQTYIFPFDFDW
jgi:hypothetical protein